ACRSAIAFKMYLCIASLFSLNIAVSLSMPPINVEVLIYDRIMIEGYLILYISKSNPSSS
ncbi:MAG: hypothetical protein QXS81_01810, partial [Candidatus Micrarchaeaceae archaeon]